MSETTDPLAWIADERPFGGMADRGGGTITEKRRITPGGNPMTSTKKALVLSGGGARGAYHIGAIEALIRQGWMQDGVGPDIIAGTSIGATNAAALASGLTIA